MLAFTMKYIAHLLSSSILGNLSWFGGFGSPGFAGKWNFKDGTTITNKYYMEAIPGEFYGLDHNFYIDLEIF